MHSSVSAFSCADPTRGGGGGRNWSLLASANGCTRYQCGVRKPGQKTPEGYYNLERMLKGCTVKGVVIGACGTCMDARGMADGPLIEGIHRSTMAELTTWTIWADKVIVF